MSALGHLRTCAWAAAMSASHQQADIFQFAVSARFFPIWNKKNSLFQLQGIRPKKSRVSMGFRQAGRASRVKFPVFSRRSGSFNCGDAFAVACQHSQNISHGNRIIICHLDGSDFPRNPGHFSVPRRRPKRQRRFCTRSWPARTRKSLGRLLGVHFSWTAKAQGTRATEKVVLMRVGQPNR
jgi:hypothetical protein